MLIPNNLAVFYRRKLISNHSFHNISLEPESNAVIATKNGISAGICVDEYESSNKSLDAICAEYGFGWVSLLHLFLILKYKIEINNK